MGLLREVVERQAREAWADGRAVERSPEGHQADLVDRVLGALEKLGVDEALVSGDHYAEFTVTAWVVQHPLHCRPDMLSCVVSRRMQAEVDGPPEQGPGRYRARIVGGELEFVPAGRPDA